MAWVTTGEATVQKQRDRWVVRISGYDSATGRRRVRQLGTHATKKAAVALWVPDNASWLVRRRFGIR